MWWKKAEEEEFEVVLNPPDPENYDKFFLTDTDGYFWNAWDEDLHMPAHSQVFGYLMEQGVFDSLDDMDNVLSGRNYGDHVEAYKWNEQDHDYDTLMRWYPNATNYNINGEDYGMGSGGKSLWGWYKQSDPRFEQNDEGNFDLKFDKGEENFMEPHFRVGDEVQVLHSGEGGHIEETLDVDYYAVMTDSGDIENLRGDQLQHAPEGQTEPGDMSHERFIGDDPEAQNFEDPTFTTGNYIDDDIDQLREGDLVRCLLTEEGRGQDEYINQVGRVITVNGNMYEIEVEGVGVTTFDRDSIELMPIDFNPHYGHGNRMGVFFPFPPMRSPNRPGREYDNYNWYGDYNEDGTRKEFNPTNPWYTEPRDSNAYPEDMMQDIVSKSINQIDHGDGTFTLEFPNGSVSTYRAISQVDRQGRDAWYYTKISNSWWKGADQLFTDDEIETQAVSPYLQPINIRYLQENWPMETLVQNILDAYEDSTEEEYNAGIEWYNKVHNIAKEFSEAYGYSFEVICAVFARLSPNLYWDINYVQAIAFIEAHAQGVKNWEDVRIWTPYSYEGKPCGYGNNNRLAWEILETGDLSLVRGEKIESFMHNFINGPDDPDTKATVDIWATRVAFKDPLVEPHFNDRDGSYAYMEQAYNIAAERVGLTPKQMQAVTWVHYKNKYGKKRGPTEYVDRFNEWIQTPMEKRLPPDPSQLAYRPGTESPDQMNLFAWWKEAVDHPEYSQYPEWNSLSEEDQLAFLEEERAMEENVKNNRFRNGSRVRTTRPLGDIMGLEGDDREVWNIAVPAGSVGVILGVESRQPESYTLDLEYSMPPTALPTAGGEVMMFGSEIYVQGDDIEPADEPLRNVYDEQKGFGDYIPENPNDPLENLWKNSASELEDWWQNQYDRTNGEVRSELYEAIMQAGGISTRDDLREEYRQIPNTYKRKDGLRGDEMAEHLAVHYPHFNITDENSLIEELGKMSYRFAWWKEAYPNEVINRFVVLRNGASNLGGPSVSEEKLLEGLGADIASAEYLVGTVEWDSGNAQGNLIITSDEWLTEQQTNSLLGFCRNGQGIINGRVIVTEAGQESNLSLEEFIEYLGKNATPAINLSEDEPEEEERGEIFDRFVVLPDGRSAKSYSRLHSQLLEDHFGIHADLILNRNDPPHLRGLIEEGILYLYSYQDLTPEQAQATASLVQEANPYYNDWVDIEIGDMAAGLTTADALGWLEGITGKEAMIKKADYYAAVVLPDGRFAEGRGAYHQELLRYHFNIEGSFIMKPNDPPHIRIVSESNWISVSSFYPPTPEQASAALQRIEENVPNPWSKNVMVNFGGDEDMVFTWEEFVGFMNKISNKTAERDWKEDNDDEFNWMEKEIDIPDDAFDKLLKMEGDIDPEVGDTVRHKVPNTGYVGENSHAGKEGEVLRKGEIGGKPNSYVRFENGGLLWVDDRDLVVTGSWSENMRIGYRKTSKSLGDVAEQYIEHVRQGVIDFDAAKQEITNMLAAAEDIGDVFDIREKLLLLENVDNIPPTPEEVAQVEESVAPYQQAFEAEQEIGGATSTDGSSDWWETMPQEEPNHEGWEPMPEEETFQRAAWWNR
jgi:hypothetical protein